MSTQTVADLPAALQPRAAASGIGHHRDAAPKREHSQHFQLVQRLEANHAPPIAWAVALKLFSYIRRNAQQRLTVSVYHDKLAAEMNVSRSGIRRAIRWLTTGAAPLFLKRGATGQTRTLRWDKGQQLTTSGVELEWIDHLAEFLSAQATARAVNVLAFEDRQKDQHPERVQLQAALLKGTLSQDEYAQRTSKLEKVARMRLPKAATKQPRCLTAKQLGWFADQLARVTHAERCQRLGLGPDRAEARRFHALYAHVFGKGKQGTCVTCETAAATAMQRVPPVANWLANFKGKVERCGCGERVVISPVYGTTLFWSALAAESDDDENHNDCIHERNRLLILNRQ